MNVLLWRGWRPLYAFPATFSSLLSQGIGGTCSQLLWHARNLRLLGARVQVLGATTENCVEEGVEFIGAGSFEEQLDSIRTGRTRPPDIVFLEGAFTAAPVFRERFPNAHLIHIGQNIDRNGASKALAYARLMNRVAFVSLGQLAHYCAARPGLMPRFALIRNIVPWESIYSSIAPAPVQPNTVLWVGGWTKLGLRSWARTMERVIAQRPEVRWKLLGPQYGAHVRPELPSNVLKGLTFPRGAVEVGSLPLRDVFVELTKSQVVIVSLGDETACISALDAHAAGRPVISGNDVVFKFANPEGAGIRVFSAEERFLAITRLLSDSSLSDEMGRSGKRAVLNGFQEIHQRNDIQDVIELVVMQKRFGDIQSNMPPSRFRSSVLRFNEKFQRRFVSLFPK